MLYSSTTTPNLKKNYKLKILRLNKQKRRLNINLRDINTLKFSSSFFSLLPNWNYSLIVPKNNQDHFKIIYFYTSSYFFNLPLPVKFIDLKFDKGSHSFLFTARLSSNFLKPYLNLVRLLFHVFYKPLFIKLKFKGKGYYIYKNKRSTITPQMGYAHRIYVYAFSIIVKFLAKTKIFLFGLSKNDILKIGHAIKKIRPINVFTGRGIRFRKQIIYRKVGKVSSYR